MKTWIKIFTPVVILAITFCGCGTGSASSPADAIVGNYLIADTLLSCGTFSNDVTGSFAIVISKVTDNTVEIANFKCTGNRDTATVTATSIIATTPPQCAEGITGSISGNYIYFTFGYQNGACYQNNARATAVKQQ